MYVGAGRLNAGVIRDKSRQKHGVISAVWVSNCWTSGLNVWWRGTPQQREKNKKSVFWPSQMSMHGCLDTWNEVPQHKKFQKNVKLFVGQAFGSFCFLLLLIFNFSLSWTSLILLYYFDMSEKGEFFPKSRWGPSENVLWGWTDCFKKSGKRFNNFLTCSNMNRCFLEIVFASIKVITTVDLLRILEIQLEYCKVHMSTWGNSILLFLQNYTLTLNLLLFHMQTLR